MPAPEAPKIDIHSDEFLHSLMRRQLRLSILCAAAFLLVLFLLPVANYYFPELMATRVFGGFTLTWFLLGIGFLPAVWLIAWLFIKRSIALEEAEVSEVEKEKGGEGEKERGAEAALDAEEKRRKGEKEKGRKGEEEKAQL